VALAARAVPRGGEGEMGQTGKATARWRPVGSSFDLLTLREAAALTRISPFTLDRWAQKGWLPCSVGTDGQRLFKREDLEAIAVTPEDRQDDADE
jgi:hypothetical protein